MFCLWRTAVVMSYHSEKLRILLVEDTPYILRNSQVMLEKLNCDITVATTYAEALEKFDLSFDGILTDIGLPDGNGCDFVKWIAENHPDNKAIIYVYSAFSINYIEEKIKNLPIQSYFTKPYSEKDMQNFVNAVLINKRM